MNAEIVRSQCFICGVAKQKLFHKFRGLWFVQCCGCGVIQREFLPRLPETYPVGLTERQEFEQFYLKARILSSQIVLPYFEKKRLSNRILDIGCGFGDFLAEAKKLNWDTFGVEPLEYKQKYATATLGLNVRLGIFDSNIFPAESFDIVTLWDVIEHVEAPVKLVQACWQVLRKGGFLFIKTPDARGLLPPATLVKDPLRWAYQHLVFPINPKEHLFFLTPAQLERLVKPIGFKVIQCDIDELLDERIISGSNFIIRSVRRPLMWLAWKNGWPFEMGILFEKI